MLTIPTSPWALLLAGGDGRRLKPLTAFEGLCLAMGSPRETAAAERVYGGLADCGFSERVLVPGADRLLTICVKSVDWSDWGHPQRVIATMHRTGWRPAWLKRVELASAG